MRLGIVADSHDNLGRLQQALAICRRQAVETVIHCGDFTRPAAVELLVDVRVVAVLGNMDFDPAALAASLTALHPANSLGETFVGQLGGLRLGVTHGHQPQVIEGWLRQGQLDLVLHGHTHRRRDERRGAVRLINPGALGGVRHEPRSFCLLDLATGTADFVELGAY